MSSSSSEVLLTLSPPRATITLNRPTRGNSLSPQLQSLFESYLDRIDSNSLIHYLVLTGNGKFFCTGMDLGSGGGATEGGDKDQIFNRAKGFFQKVEMFRKPIIGLANGPSFGGGVGLFFLTDIRLCPISTTFTLTEVKRGLIAATISPTIIREWGVGLSRQAMISSKPIKASQLESIGAVITFQDTPGEGEKVLENMCKMLEKCGPNAMVRSKRLIGTQAGTGLEMLEKEKREERALQVIKNGFQEMMGPSREALEGIMKFRQSKGKEDVDWLEVYKEWEKEREEDEKEKSKL